ncbi:MAG TPA: hypothetical protein VN692_20260 [Steroidobacteraceae bacterium]|nr:hypothetical protein [Steroidobacteraceae bacterium]
MQPDITQEGDIEMMHYLMNRLSESRARLRLVSRKRTVGDLTRTGFVLILLMGCMTFGLSKKTEAATIPVVIDVCSTCNNYASLNTEATRYLHQWLDSGKSPPGYVGYVNSPPVPTGSCQQGGVGGTVLLVVSSSAPLSSSFYGCWVYPQGMGIMRIMPISTASDVGAISSDNRLLSRSAKQGKITLPVGIPVTDTPEQISAWLSSAQGIPIAGSPALGIWHGLANFPQFLEGTFINTETGQIFKLWNGDTITVTDSNGYTVQLQWQPLSTVQWAVVPGSIRDASGKPLAGNNSVYTPKSGGYAEPVGSITVSYSGGPTIWLMPWYDNPTPGGMVIIGDPIYGGGGGEQAAVDQPY